MAKAAPAATEAEMVDMLRKRCEQDSGNGPQGAIVPQVRDAAGFDAKRTIDAIGIGFWPSRGLLIDAYECKSSRSDFQRELNAPAKAERFSQLADRFWIVAGDSDVVRDPAELPEPWGLLVARGGKLVQVKAAQLLRPAQRGRPLPPAFDRGFLVALIRQAHRLAGAKPEEVIDAERQAYDRGKVMGEQAAGLELERLRGRMAEVEEFERGLGMRAQGHRTFGPRGGEHAPEAVGRVVRAVLDGDNDVEGLRNRLSAAASQAKRLAEEAQQRLEALDTTLEALGQEATHA